MINFWLVNIIVIFSSWLFTFKILKLESFTDSLLALIIIYCSQIILSELFLGIFGILNLDNLIFLQALLLLIAFFSSRGYGYASNFPFGREQVEGLLKNKIILLAVTVISGFAMVKIFKNLMNPPFGWDDLNYHFTFAVEWLKHGNLDTPITVFDDPSPSYYPVNGSLIFLWLMLPFKSVFLADLGQVPFFAVGFLAVYSLSRKLNLGKENSFLAACLFTLIPNYFKQLQVAYVDVMAGSLFLACVNWIFSLNEKFSLKGVMLYSLSLGLFIGTKTLALPYSILLILPFICILSRNIKKAGVSLVLSVLTLVLLGGFSYIRNFAYTGNPLYPLDFSLFGMSILRGVMTKATYAAHFIAGDYRIDKLLFHEGLGAQTLLFVLPGTIFALPFIFLRRRKSLSFILAYFLILPVFIYLVYRYIIPLANTRYLYALLGAGMVAGFYLFGAVNMPRRFLNVLIIVCILASIAELAKHQELIVSLSVSVLLFLLQKAFLNSGRKLKKLFAFIFTGFIICCLPLFRDDYQRNEFKRYVSTQKDSGFWPDATQAWEWLNNNTRGNNIAYTGRPVPFPLYGTAFKNNVFYVSVNKTEPAKLHYFKNSYYSWNRDFLSLHRNLEADGNYRSGGDYSAWLGNLKKRDIDYLFIYSLHQTKEIVFPQEYNWASGNPGNFLPVFANSTVKIYKILK